MTDVCPSCDGTSLTRTEDGGSLVCDDCNERFQGFRQEEMDDEDAANVAVFARESQQSQVTSRRLKLAAAETGARARAAAADAAGLDYGDELARGVVLIARAVVDKLVSGRYVASGIVDPCFQVVAHWVRMWHAGGRLECAFSAGDRDSFRPQAILAMVSLAAVFCRSGLLPRDICRLAVEGKIPYTTAGVDLLSGEVMQDPKLWSAFTPVSVASVREVCSIATSFAFSEYAWPPLRGVFDAPWTLYGRNTAKYGDSGSRAFPVGDQDDVVARLAALLGLPPNFVQRVARFRELRKIATAMSVKIFASYSAEIGKARGAHSGTIRSHLLRVINSAGEDGDSDSDEDGGDGGRNNMTNAQPGSQVDDKAGEPSSYLDRRDKRNEMYTFDAPPGLSQLPFTAPNKMSTSRFNHNEFPTNLSVLVDFFATLRICYGSEECDDVSAGATAENDETDAEREQREQKWSSCERVMQRWLTSGGPDANSVMWAGLTPVSLNSMSGEPLRRFAREASATTDGSVPLFLLDSVDTFSAIASAGKSQNGKRFGSSGAGDMDLDSVDNDGEDEGLSRYGTWVWNTPDGECVSRQTRTSLLQEKGRIDDSPLVERKVLLPIRGYMSFPLSRRKVSRGLHWWTRGPRADVLWQEPVGIGLALSMCRAFFRGTPGLVAGEGTEASDPGGEYIHSGCDRVLTVVFNYVDVFLGEEGDLDWDRERDDDPFVRMKLAHPPRDAPNPAADTPNPAADADLATEPT